MNKLQRREFIASLVAIGVAKGLAIPVATTQPPQQQWEVVRRFVVTFYVNDDGSMETQWRES